MRGWVRKGRGGPLRALELAEAAVLADLAVALCLAGWFLPFGGVLVAAAVTPFAAVASRHRLRATIAGAAIALGISVLIAGTSMATTIVGCSVLGAVIGSAHRRGWGPVRTVALAVAVAWPPAAALAVAAFAVLSRLRKLTLDNAVNTWQGLSRTLRRAGLTPIVHVGDTVVYWGVKHWPITVPLGLLGGVILAAMVANAIARPALARIDRALPPAPAPDRSAGRTAGRAAGSAANGKRSAAGAPVPVEAVEVRFRYPGAASDALRGVSMRIDAGEFVAVVGPNGSGKSTLARLLAGLAQPTAGAIRRSGAAAVGHAGGTAFIFQRPETQVLGVRVRDDVIWGLPRGHGVDYESLLERVGLGGMGDRETSTLSGGELQRLAVAAALARRPRLVISDESTAMVDHDGRGQLVDLLSRLSSEDGIAVLHVTHREEEAAVADRVIALDHGRVVERVPAPAPSPPLPNGRRAIGMPLLRLDGVSHTYSPGTPWAQAALEDINLTIGRGESLLVLGHNGSGKSTLAWIIAGLIVPTVGQATIDGVAIREARGLVSLSFQHPRLQLLRATVGSDIVSASGCRDAEVGVALRAVGLDPGLAERRVDQLSGGQLRRVALAGLLARRPMVLVLDEPFAGLDTAARRSLIALLCQLRDQRGLTLVLVSHDVEGADELVDRAVVLQRGRIVADVGRHEVTSMSQLFTASAAGAAGGLR
jgi:energy-coupling factor transport system ATP-binding protein